MIDSKCSSPNRWLDVEARTLNQPAIQASSEFHSKDNWAKQFRARHWFSSKKNEAMTRQMYWHMSLLLTDDLPGERKHFQLIHNRWPLLDQKCLFSESGKMSWSDFIIPSTESVCHTWILFTAHTCVITHHWDIPSLLAKNRVFFLLS